MNRFKNILFVCTGQDADLFAFNQALELAKINSARLSILATYEPVSSFGKVFFGKEKLDELNTALEEKLTQAVEELVAGHAEKIEKRLITAARSPLETIYRVLENDFDLVIKVKETSETAGRLSNTDMRLLRKCPCPVWMINDDYQRGFTRILAAIDPNPTEVERVQLQYEVMKLATSLAKRENAKLDILYAWEFYYEITLKSPRFHMSNEEIAELSNSEEATHQNWLQDAVEAFEDKEQPFDTHLIQGKPSQKILEFIAENNCNLLVIGTVARTGIPGLLIGNTAETVLSQANCSILTIKPPNFKSPVTLE